MTDDLEDLQKHCRVVAKQLLHGRVVPFLGAGVNLCDRPAKLKWQGPGELYLPSGQEMAHYLARAFGYQVREAESELDLARISQYGATMLGGGPLYENLRQIFVPEFQPTTVHHFLARLQSPNAERSEDRYPLIVTTNYDDLTEKALGKGQYDLVFYDPEGQPRPSFWHLMPPSQQNPFPKPCPILDPGAYDYNFFSQYPVLLKIHGTFDRVQPERDGYMITEDHYIEYLAESPMESLLPSRLLQKMRDKHHFLFLGYSLRDWNLRVFLRRLKRNPRGQFRSWAVLVGSSRYDEQFWMKNDVDIIKVDLNTYIATLQAEMAALQSQELPQGG